MRGIEGAKAVRFTAAFFEREDDLIAGAADARLAGFEVFDVYTPFPVHGMDRAVALPPSRLTWIAFLAGALGLVGLPNIWLFQLLFPLLAPAADIALLVALARLGLEMPALGVHAAWRHAEPVLSLYTFFLVIDTITAVLGVALESGEKLSQAMLVPLQRIAYRQVLYLALVRAMRAALKGWAPGWGKLERTGRVSAVPTPLAGVES